MESELLIDATLHTRCGCTRTMQVKRPWPPYITVALLQLRVDWSSDPSQPCETRTFDHEGMGSYIERREKPL